MPYKSKRQMRWAHTTRGKKALGAEKVAEFDAATKGKKLPETVKPRKKTRRRGK